MKYTATLQKIAATRYLLPALALFAGVVGYTGVHAYAAKPTDQQNTCSRTCVSILESGFSQGEIAVKVGEFVEFRSADGKAHDLALGEGADHGAHDEQSDTEHTDSEYTHDHITGTNSGKFGPDEAWKVQFKKAGSYIIHDHLRPEFTILVVAYQPNSPN